MSLRKSYGSVLVILKIVSLPGTIISSKSSLLVLEQNVLEVIDCGGRTKFDILLTTGAKASFWQLGDGVYGAPDDLVLELPPHQHRLDV